MNKWCVLIAYFFISIPVASAQDVKIVFDVTSPDEQIHQSTMRHVKAMADAYPDAEFEVVVYSGALSMMLKDKSTVSEEITEALKNKNVSMNVCAMTLKRHELDPSALVEGVGTVPDGILEIIQKQAQGWGYIKEAN